MSDYIHSREYLEIGDVVVVDCSHQCNVMITDDFNYNKFKSDRDFEYYGGFYERLPARISVPRSDYWNVTIDLGGGTANIEYAINFIKG